MVSSDSGLVPTQRLTPGAQAVLERAAQEARSLDHNYVGQEHLLIALAADEGTTGAKVLTQFGVTIDRVRTAVIMTVGRGHSNWPAPEEHRLTPRAVKVMDLAVEEARRLNHYHIGTGHLLLGLLREETGMAMGLLITLGVRLDAAREAAVQLLAERTDQDPWLKRYQLVLPADLFEAVQRLAAREDATVQEVLRRFIRLGLLVTDMQRTPGAELILRDAGGERRLVLI
jgi:ATP-dependent Clp protease ATP-binding subunit ClpA